MTKITGKSEATVKNYKTSGSEMASAISALGATATNANVPLEEQLAIMGQLQTTMSGSEAATKYKSFLNQASSAGEKLGLTFLDTNNQLLSMPDILTELKSKYGETIDAVEKRELKEAFGTDEAVALIDLLYNNVETLDSGIQDLQGSMKNGISVTEEMAEAINNTPEQKFQVLKQQIHNNVEELGNGLLPAVNNTMDKVSGLIQKGSKWISNNQETVQSIMNIALKLGVFLVIAGSVMGVIGSLGKLFLSAKNAIGLVKTATLGMNTAFLASPITWVIAGIVALVAAFVVLWNKSEAFRGFWIGLFEQVKSSFMQAWQILGGFASGFLDVVGGALSAIGIDATETITKMKDTIKNGLEAVKGFFGNILGAASDTVKEKLGNMKAAYEEHGGGIKGVAAAAVEGVKGYYTAGFTFIDNLTGGKLTNIKNQFSEKMSGVANAVSSGMLAAKNYASTQLSNMQAAYQSSGGGIKGIVAATMTGVQGTFSTAYSVINNLTGGKLESIRSTISNKIQAAKDTVSSVLDSIKSAFSSKLEAARSVVSSTIEKIKGVFNFSWKLPDLKLPHISVNGGQAPYGIGGKGSLPSFSIQWYKEGGILNGATIFGAMGGNLLGGGEAGAEAVLPLSELWKQMTEIVKGVVKGENEESGDTVQQTGANITSALTSKAASVRKEKESG